MAAQGHRIVQIADWLPPEFSAVSQYALRIGERLAREGADVTIIGLTSGKLTERSEPIGDGRLTIIPVFRERYDKERWLERLVWSLSTNLMLIRRGWPHLRRCDTIRFTGSPPFLLHLLFLANLILRKRLVYRITDFYPEVVMAALDRPSWALDLLRRVTNLLRRHVDAFEAIGEDSRRRLIACGVKPERIALDRDDSPVVITAATQALPRPPGCAGKAMLLYSGNLGVAHDVDTFFEGYRRHHREGSGTTLLWLNAAGSGAGELAQRLAAAGLPVHRTALVPLEDLPRLLVTPDAHLVTLKDSFAGFVLPSKTYGCLASGLPLLYIGPTDSDVHLLAEESGVRYRRVAVGDAAGVAGVLEEIGATVGDRPPDSPSISPYAGAALEKSASDVPLPPFPVPAGGVGGG